MMDNEKEKLEAMRTSLEIIRKYSTDPEEKKLFTKLMNTNDKEKVDEELMMKLIHSTYTDYNKSNESKNKS